MVDSSNGFRRRPRSVRCGCGSGRLAWQCCRGEKSHAITLPFPGASTEGLPDEIVALTPERMEEILVAFEAARGHRPGDDCPICAVQRRWAEEDRRRAGG